MTTAYPVGPESEISYASRFYGAFWGFYVGDALAAPSHGYSQLKRLHDDYGWITDYVPVHNPHPESTLFRTRYEVINDKNNIVHGRDQQWRVPGTHYHQNLKPGENTLNVQLARMLMEMLVEMNGYDAEAYLKRYAEFMLSPDSHNDTYISESHRDFFTNYARGRALGECAVESNSMGGLAVAMPLAFYYWKDKNLAFKLLQQHLAATHKGESTYRVACLLVNTFIHLMRGHDLETALFIHAKEETPNALLSFTYRRWRNQYQDEEVVRKYLKTGPHIDSAVPLIIYLALKYQDDVEAALIANANLGGDSCPRGAILGMLLGAAQGCEQIPAELVEGLTAYSELDNLSDSLAEQAL